MRNLRRRGFDAYLVGGSVRDLLLNKKPKDFDIVTDAHPRQIKRIFRRCFLIGKRFRLAHVYISRDRFVEVATFRGQADPDQPQEGKYAANNVYGVIEEDAFRRDFTVNALYLNSADFSLVDYNGGLRDIRKRLLRSVGDPYERFRDDPVRIIRAARFCAQLGLSLHGRDRRASARCAGLISESSTARLLEELYKILRCGSAAKAVLNLNTSKILHHWLPEISDRGRFPRLVKLLRVVDEYRRQGETLSNGLLLAVIMYDLLMDSIEKSIKDAGFHDAYLFVKEEHRDMAIRMRIPRREWDTICNITARQLVLTAIGQGRRWKRFEKRFINNSYFDEALLLLKIRHQSSGTLEKEVLYWEEQSSRKNDPDIKKHKAPVKKKRNRPSSARAGGKKPAVKALHRSGEGKSQNTGR